MPSLSIITICFNNLKDVIATCKSVDEQLMMPFEHIIVDGSTTGEIREYLEGSVQPAYRRWICERDNGIADAFNKGIRNAKGEVTLLLNSGDELYDNTVLQRVSKEFESDPSLMWCHGKLKMMRGGVWVVVGKAKWVGSIQPVSASGQCVSCSTRVAVAHLICVYCVVARSRSPLPKTAIITANLQAGKADA